MPQTIGQMLKKERESLFITLEKASDETRIRKIFLQALESDDYSVMPSAAQGRGFLRIYSEYLNLNIDELIAEIQKNPPVIEEVAGPLPQVNLQETEIPPLVEEDEKPLPFWTRWLGAKPQADSTPETESMLEDKSQITEAEQVEVSDEAKPNLVERIKSMFRFNLKKEESESNQEVEIEPEKEIVLEEKIPTQPADMIFAEIGQQLRTQRELISLTIEEVERHTKLRAPFVKALEEGSFEKLPSPVQTRGMLQNYATFLDLDADKILLRFADALQARRREKYAETPREKIQTQVNASIPWLRTFIAGDLVFGLAMIALLVTLAIWGVGRVVRLQNEQEVEPTLIPFVDVFDQSLPTPTIELTFVPVNDPSVATSSAGNAAVTLLAPSPEVNANVVVSLFALKRVFVQISVDGKIVFEGRMSPRETQVFQAENQVVVLTGDGSALRVTYNGQDLGLMGGAGEVVNRAYLVTGVATPTATVPPTATNTPLTTPTFTPSITPSVTPTVTESQ
jgi:cytoskeletal protein RodZ